MHEGAPLIRETWDECVYLAWPSVGRLASNTVSDWTSIKTLGVLWLNTCATDDKQVNCHRCGEHSIAWTLLRMCSKPVFFPSICKRSMICKLIYPPTGKTHEIVREKIGDGTSVTPRLVTIRLTSIRQLYTDQVTFNNSTTVWNDATTKNEKEMK